MKIDDIVSELENTAYLKMREKHIENDKLLHSFIELNNNVCSNFWLIKKYVLKEYDYSLLDFNEITSFTNIYFDINKYNKIYMSELINTKDKYNNDFQNIIDILNEKYDRNKLLPFWDDNKASYLIKNITPIEKTIFNITNDYLFLNFNLLYTTKYRDIYCNFLNKYNKDTPKQQFPLLNPEGLIRKDKKYFSDELFFSNHIEDLDKAAEYYKNRHSETIKNHMDYLNYANSLIDKYVVLAKI